MFEFIIGKIVSIKNDYVVIQNNGIGYKVFTSSYTMSKLILGKSEQILYTQLQVREDGMFLFGFASEEEMDMFNLLILVSKIGPKTAVGILSALSPAQIKVAILNKNIDELCKGPGVGKKTAERIIVELRDRIDVNSITEEIEEGSTINNDYNEAIQALMSLGYSRYEVERVINTIETENMNLETMIKEGLKRLSKH
ncbi:Holliday junction branch migration protein RuvA [Tissierella sp. Yu-01]|uniref:Holliday junction branch migration protein RuvA n=1 Tax=Tissierella sp. Yu-01 TaxID=3035694 RepID=UPI00240D7339|nr:Holliday junction branch migration protein RuvA [Tissierella sp. Yu-01]WFA09857.1 Holliday junction branch migration protein RuvA [Tissierella sp. Yu-01]